MSLGQFPEILMVEIVDKISQRGAVIGKTLFSLRNRKLHNQKCAPVRQKGSYML